MVLAEYFRNTLGMTYKNTAKAVGLENHTTIRHYNEKIWNNKFELEYISDRDKFQRALIELKVREELNAA